MRCLTKRGTEESGTAMVIALLVLFIISVLGMALMLTTKTETEIATNYKWGAMAFYNADAGLEYGKNVLAAYALRDGDLMNALPPPRAPGRMNLPPDDPVACPDPGQAGCRDNQYSMPQSANTVYIGRVLRDLDGRPIQFDFRRPVSNDTRGDINNDNSTDVQGTVTLWVRRPTFGAEDYGFSDKRHDRAILTAEGTAPNYEGIATGKNVSVRRLEIMVSLSPDSSIIGDRYSDPTKGSQPGDALEGNWRVVQRLQ